MPTSLRRLISYLWHRLAERFGWATGTIETWWDGSELMVGFRCSCGDLRDISPVAGFRLDRGPYPWGEFPENDTSESVTFTLPAAAPIGTTYTFTGGRGNLIESRLGQ